MSQNYLPLAFDDQFVDSEWPGGSMIGDNKKNMQSKGYVKWVGSKPYGSSLSWTFRLNDVDMWFNCGAVDPKLNKGDHIEFEYTEKNGRSSVQSATIRKLAGGEIHQGTASATLAAKSTGSVSSGREEYWNEKAKSDVQKDLRIQWQSARNAAVEVAGILVANGILKLPEKNPTEAVLGKIADLTERYFNESKGIGDEEGVLGVETGTGNTELSRSAA